VLLSRQLLFYSPQTLFSRFTLHATPALQSFVDFDGEAARQFHTDAADAGGEAKHAPFVEATTTLADDARLPYLDNMYNSVDAIKKMLHVMGTPAFSF
jgi:hypothetical protein